MLIRMMMNGFWASTGKQAKACERQGCRIAGDGVLSVFPPAGVWLNLPFAVASYGGVSLGRRFRLVREIATAKDSGAVAPAVWEIPDRRGNGPELGRKGKS